MTPGVLNVLCYRRIYRFLQVALVSAIKVLFIVNIEAWFIVNRTGDVQRGRWRGCDGVFMLLKITLLSLDHFSAL